MCLQVGTSQCNATITSADYQQVCLCYRPLTHASPKWSHLRHQNQVPSSLHYLISAIAQVWYGDLTTSWHGASSDAVSVMLWGSSSKIFAIGSKCENVLSWNRRLRIFQIWAFYRHNCYYAPPLIGDDDVWRLTSVCLTSVAYIGPKSRKESLGKLKLAQR